MNELLSQALYLILEIFDRLNEKFISIVKDYNHLLRTNLVQTATITRITKFSHLVKLISEHVFIPYVVKIDKEIDLVHPTLNKICCCFDGKWCFTHSRVSVKEEKIKIRLFYLLHKLV